MKLMAQMQSVDDWTEIAKKFGKNYGNSQVKSQHNQASNGGSDAPTQSLQIIILKIQRRRLHMPGPTSIVWNENSIKQGTVGNQSFIFNNGFDIFAQWPKYKILLFKNSLSHRNFLRQKNFQKIKIISFHFAAYYSRLSFATFSLHLWQAECYSTLDSPVYEWNISKFECRSFRVSLCIIKP